MKKRRKIIVSIAMSTDGFIARPDGDVAWFDRPGPKRDYGMGQFFKTIDTILWGRKTYDKGIEMGMKVSEFGPGVKNYLYFSPSPEVVGCRGSGAELSGEGPFVGGSLRHLGGRATILLLPGTLRGSKGRAQWQSILCENDSA